METTQDINSILSKLKKLQRLYEGAKAINSEAEAANAAAKIQNLLTQYNLSMVDLDSVADDSQKSSVTEDQLDDRWSRKTGGAWDQLLLYGICKYNFCYTIVSQKHTSRITSGGRLVYEVRRKFIVIGEQQNIEVVKWLFAVLSRQLYELSKKRYKEYLADDSQALIRSFTGEKAHVSSQVPSFVSDGSGQRCSGPPQGGARPRTPGSSAGQRAGASYGPEIERLRGRELQGLTLVASDAYRQWPRYGDGA